MLNRQLKDYDLEPRRPSVEVLRRWRSAAAASVRYSPISISAEAGSEDERRGKAHRIRRSAVTLVKNRRSRFRTVADLDKRSSWKRRRTKRKSSQKEEIHRHSRQEPPQPLEAKTNGSEENGSERWHSTFTFQAKTNYSS